MGANPFQLHSVSASNHLRTPSIMALHGIKVSPYLGSVNFRLGASPNGALRNAKPNICCAMNMTAGQSGDPEKLNFEQLVNTARKLWDSSPQPVKSFPWNRALENFVQLILDLFVAVVKYLSVPLLAVSSLSEMSYCAHEKKLFLVPIPLLIGIAITDVLKEAILELSPLLKDAEVPWHLIAIAILCTLLKLPGPYYPYWGRLFVPHFANGALLRTLWLAILWYRRPKKASETTPLNDSANTCQSEPNKL